MSPYLRYMSLAFASNGLGAFGLRVLAGAGLGNVGETRYLAIWYAAGLFLALWAYLRSHGRPEIRELVIGLGMACCSLCGQLGMALSLAGGIPGFIVFPVATGGGLLLVVIVGRTLYQEPLGGRGTLGIAIGVLALVLLALPE